MLALHYLLATHTVLRINSLLFKSFFVLSVLTASQKYDGYNCMNTHATQSLDLGGLKDIFTKTFCEYYS